MTSLYPTAGTASPARAGTLLAPGSSLLSVRPTRWPRRVTAIAAPGSSTTPSTAGSNWTKSVGAVPMSCRPSVTPATSHRPDPAPRPPDPGLPSAIKSPRRPGPAALSTPGGCQCGDRAPPRRGDAPRTRPCDRWPPPRPRVVGGGGCVLVGLLPRGHVVPFRFLSLRHGVLVRFTTTTVAVEASFSLDLLGVRLRSGHGSARRQSSASSTVRAAVSSARSTAVSAVCRDAVSIRPASSPRKPATVASVRRS